MTDQDKQDFQECCAHFVNNDEQFNIILDAWNKDPQSLLKHWRDLKNVLSNSSTQFHTSIPDIPPRAGDPFQQILNRIEALEDSIDFFFEILEKKGLLPPPGDNNKNL